MKSILKYPRTHHLQGSRLQAGDEDLDSVPFATLRGRHLVIEEKVDGANAGLRFDPEGQLLLQSRGHYLTGGGRERHFAQLKTWAAAHHEALYAALGSRYVLYGEWVYAKHTIFYDALPHYLLEFDVYDTTDEVFLSTPRRRALLEAAPVVSVPVLAEGALADPSTMVDLVGPSNFIRPGHLDRLAVQATRSGARVERTLEDTDPSVTMEGLYVKVEEDGQVLERYKWVRASFLAKVVASDSHWQSRPIVPNLLAEGVDLYAPAS